MITSQDRKRLVAISFFLFFLFCGLIVQFYKIQILEEEKWTQVANGQHKAVLIEPFRRGTFYSNGSLKKGHPEKDQSLVMDVPKFHLYIDPKAIPAHAKERIVSKILTMFQVKDREKLIAQFYKRSRSRKLIPWLDAQDQERILAWWREFAKKEKIAQNALYFIKDYKRSYPFGKMLGPLLHTVQDQKDPKTFQSLPTGGLEMQFHDVLKGKLGKRVLFRSPRHPLDMGEVIEVPEDGGDVYLTINHYLQQICEEGLERGIRRANAKGGWVVLMEPNTGEILALAQYPPFDPAEYPKYFNDPKMQDRTRIKAVTDAFEPGSIFKAISLAIGLNANEEMIRRGKEPLFDPYAKMATDRGDFPKTRFRLKDGRKHNFLNMPLALQKSSNIYPGRVVQKILENLGEKWFRDQFTEVFGFGRKTNVEIPAETCGLVPHPDRVHPNGKPEWSVPTPYSLAMGHNILVNSLHIVRAYAMIANGGFDVQPTIVRKIVKNGEIVDNQPEKERKRILSTEVTKMMRDGMKYVTKLGGSAPRGDISGYSEAGKSGTSEKIIDGKYSHEKYLSSFCGFAPAENARFVLLVTLDEPEVKFIPGVGKNHMGGTSAGPIFGEIGTRVLQYLGVAEDDKDRTDWKKETKELRELYIEWNSK